MTTENTAGMADIKEPVVSTDNSSTENTSNSTTGIPANEAAPKVEEVKENGALKDTLSKIEEESKYWQDDWKEKLADGDEKMAKMLEKYKSPSDLGKAYQELQKQFSKTRPLPELPKNATEAQIKEYREKAGIPETYEGYKTDLNDGIVIGDSDKPIVDQFLKSAHKHNLTQPEVSKALNAYFEMQNEMQSQATKELESKKQESISVLQKQYGAEFKSNVNQLKSYVEKELGSDIWEALDNAILPDGSYLILNQKIFNHFLDKSKSSQGSHTLTPSGQGSFESAIARKNELQKLASSNPKEWYNNPELRQELAQLDEQLRRRK